MMQTRTEVEIVPPQDVARIYVRGPVQYEIVIMRDTYHSQLTLVFPDFESLAKMVGKLHADVANLRKPIEERVWR